MTKTYMIWSVTDGHLTDFALLLFGPLARVALCLTPLSLFATHVLFLQGPGSWVAGKDTGETKGGG